MFKPPNPDVFDGFAVVFVAFLLLLLVLLPDEFPKLKDELLVLLLEVPHPALFLVHDSNECKDLQRINSMDIPDELLLLLLLFEVFPQPEPKPDPQDIINADGRLEVDGERMDCGLTAVDVVSFLTVSCWNNENLKQKKIA